jgi:hypothetical protein
MKNFASFLKLHASTTAMGKMHTSFLFPFRMEGSMACVTIKGPKTFTLCTVTTSSIDLQEEKALKMSR